MDESVYGVRDMAGSASEYTSDKTTGRYRYISRRGGNWNTTDEFEYRIPTRNGILPENSRIGAGFRLLAEPPRD
jgi:hypothetical protein